MVARSFAHGAISHRCHKVSECGYTARIEKNYSVSTVYGAPAIADPTRGVITIIPGLE